jgi:hypothetical protein
VRVAGTHQHAEQYEGEAQERFAHGARGLGAEREESPLDVEQQPAAEDHERRVGVRLRKMAQRRVHPGKDLDVREEERAADEPGDAAFGGDRAIEHMVGERNDGGRAREEPGVEAGAEHDQQQTRTIDRKGARDGREGHEGIEKEQRRGESPGKRGMFCATPSRQPPSKRREIQDRGHQHRDRLRRDPRIVGEKGDGHEVQRQQQRRGTAEKRSAAPEITRLSLEEAADGRQAEGEARQQGGHDRVAQQPMLVPREVGEKRAACHDHREAGDQIPVFSDERVEEIQRPRPHGLRGRDWLASWRGTRRARQRD